MIITNLICTIRILLFLIIWSWKYIPLGVKSFIYRIKTGYYKMPHFSDDAVVGVLGGFGSGKGVFTIRTVHDLIDRYPEADYKIISNMTLNTSEFSRMSDKNYRYFSNIDDISWFYEPNKNPKKDREYNHDFGILIIDELPTVCGNRDMMNSKKGKAIMNKNFIGLLHQLRKLNVVVICQFQDEAIDIVFRRLFKYIYIPRMRFFNRLNVYKKYDAKQIFNYFDDPQAVVPDVLDKRIFIVEDRFFNSYNTKELVKALKEGDYFGANDSDAPTYINNNNSSVFVNTSTHKKSLTKRIFGNKNL